MPRRARRAALGSLTATNVNQSNTKQESAVGKRRSRRRGTKRTQSPSPSLSPSSSLLAPSVPRRSPRLQKASPTKRHKATHAPPLPPIPDTSDPADGGPDAVALLACRETLQLPPESPTVHSLSSAQVAAFWNAFHTLQEEKWALEQQHSTLSRHITALRATVATGRFACDTLRVELEGARADIDARDARIRELERCIQANDSDSSGEGVLVATLTRQCERERALRDEAQHTLVEAIRTHRQERQDDADKAMRRIEAERRLFGLRLQYVSR